MYDITGIIRISIHTPVIIPGTEQTESFFAQGKASKSSSHVTPFLLFGTQSITSVVVEVRRGKSVHPSIQPLDSFNGCGAIRACLFLLFVLFNVLTPLSLTQLLVTAVVVDRCRRTTF